MKEQTFMGKYLSSIMPHGGKENPINLLDNFLRAFIRIVDKDNEKAICAHDAIKYREEMKRGKDPEKICRVCSKNLNIKGILRCNDFLIIRNKKCKGPICGDCFKNKPDKFYIAYSNALKKYNQFTADIFE